MNPSLDFGYPWWLSHGHLAVAAVSALFFRLCPGRPWLRGLLALIAVWALSVFFLVRFGVNVDAVAPLPAENFFRSGTGKVLDLGAGTGRSSIMLLRARPNATLVALDLFGQSFDQHFGHRPDPQDLLKANLRAAGVDGRASIVAADMRQLPFPDGSFDAIVSAFAVDHLPGDGVRRTLAESARVLKPGGEFLLIVVNGRDPWARFAFGPLLAHGGFRPREWWVSRFQESGFVVTESGNSPPAFYFVAKSPLAEKR